MLCLFNCTKQMTIQKWCLLPTTLNYKLIIIKKIYRKINNNLRSLRNDLTFSVPLFIYIYEKDKKEKKMCCSPFKECGVDCFGQKWMHITQLQLPIIRFLLIKILDKTEKWIDHTHSMLCAVLPHVFFLLLIINEYKIIIILPQTKVKKISLFLCYCFASVWKTKINKFRFSSINLLHSLPILLI